MISSGSSKKKRRRLSGAMREILHDNEGDQDTTMRPSVMRQFVRDNNLSCFKCGTVRAIWGKVGHSPKVGPWALCGPCVRGERPHHKST